MQRTIPATGFAIHFIVVGVGELLESGNQLPAGSPYRTTSLHSKTDIRPVDGSRGDPSTEVPGFLLMAGQERKL